MRVPPTAAVLLAVSASLVPSAVRGEETLSLSADRIERLCQRYEGKPAMVVEGEDRSITCRWIEKLAVDRPNMMVVYRRILADAATVQRFKLRAPRLLPQDLDCGAFRFRKQGTEQVLECHSDMGVDVVMRFRAAADGKLLSVDFTAPHRRVYRIAWEGAVRRGDLERVEDDWVDLQADLLVETLQQAAAPEDTVTPGEDDVFVRIVRPKR